jgi:hypothetical protein
MARSAKTKQVKIIQFKYSTQWEDCSEYEFPKTREEKKVILNDLKEYRLSHGGGAYRLITRRVPVQTTSLERAKT